MARDATVPPALRAALDEAAATAFVHVASGDDPTRRWLLGAPGSPDRDAYICVGDRAACCPGDATDAARLAVPVADADGATAADRAASVLAATDATGTVLVPPHLPHDAALRLESAGYDLASTDAVARARAAKTDRERAALDRAGAAVDAGISRARAVLDRARTGRGLRWRRDDLSAGALRREARAAVASAGATPVSVAADGVEPADPGGPVTLRVVARAEGYHAVCERTLVAEPEDGVLRRADVAGERALAAARAELAADATPAAVRTEAMAELAAFGFGAPDVAVHGVGLERRERPTGDSPVPADATLAVSLAVDTDAGPLRLADTLAVDPVARAITDAPTGLAARE